MSSELLLGKPVLYKDQYDASLLFPVPRSQNRALLPLQAGVSLPFSGADIWNGWEVSWLNAKGRPVIVHGVFRFAFDSPYIVESKSFKLYLNSFNGTQFDSLEQVQQIMQRDLSNASGSPVDVQLLPLPETSVLNGWQGHAIDLDALDITVNNYDVDASILRVDESSLATETLYSQLLKSNCPVTGQPDWATVFIRYSGPRIDHENLLRYIISFRNHAEFHEHCVERMFCDLLQQCACTQLTVYARYTRRGGLDINPFRSNFETHIDNFICARQ
jgi:7-cyano-7-deazaguanine reductase